MSRDRDRFCQAAGRTLGATQGDRNGDRFPNVPHNQTALGLILLQKFGAEEGRTSPLTESSGFRGSSNIQSLQTAGM